MILYWPTQLTMIPVVRAADELACVVASGVLRATLFFKSVRDTMEFLGCKYIRQEKYRF